MDIVKKKAHQIEDQELEAKSAKQQKLRLDIEACSDTAQVSKLKKERKNILRGMSKEVVKRKEKEIDRIVDEIDSIQDDAKMYQAVNFLNKKKPQNSFVHDEKGRGVPPNTDSELTVRCEVGNESPRKQKM